MGEKLSKVKKRLLEPTLIGPKLNYITLLATAVGVDLGVATGLLLNKFGPVLEMQRLLPLNELTFWVPVKIGLISAAATFAGKALSVAFSKPKEGNTKPGQVIQLIWKIPAVLIAAKLLGTKELLNLPANLFSREKESDENLLPLEQYPAASTAIAAGLTAQPNLNATMVNRLTAHAFNPEGVQSFVRFAQAAASDAKKPGENFLDYFKNTFLPSVIDTAGAAGIHPYTLAGLLHYGFLVNQSQSNLNADIFQEQLRLTFGALSSVAKRRLPRPAEDLSSLAQFLAFPIQGAYGSGRIGAMNMIRENNEPTISWQDLKITEIARGILTLMQIKSASPAIVRLQNRLTRDFPESIAAAQNLDKSWQNFEGQRTVAAKTIDALTEAIQDEPLFKNLLAEKPDTSTWKNWEDLGFNIQSIPWHTTHLTQTYKYYVELELEGATNPEDIGLTAMLLAIQYFGTTARQSGSKEAIRQLLSSQFEDENFWPALAKKLPQRQKQIQAIINEAEKLQPLGQNKRDAVADAFGIFSQQEQNFDWQTTALIGSNAHFINNLNQFPRLKNLAAEEPLWQLYCAMMQRELSPANLYVKRDKYPLITDVDLSSDPENILRRFDLLVAQCQKHLGNPPAAELLTYLLNYDQSADPAQVKSLYEDLFWGQAWSGIKAANVEYAQIALADDQ